MERPPIKRPNFHHLGKKKYSDLPGYLKAFDVCLMPFVISELTLHISPTKTPEYLAGGKPVVSTPIPDVVSDYSDVVAIASEPDEFIKKIDECLTSRQDDLHIRIRKKAEAKSWGHIAEEMIKIIQSPTLTSPRGCPERDIKTYKSHY
jgi:UDP-galactopyranose mutase